MSRRLPLVVVVAGLLAPPTWAEEPPPAAPGALPTAAAAAHPAAAQSGDPDFSAQLAGRLVAMGGALAAADREDRAALAAFYAARQNAPLWTSTAGLTPAAQAVIAEMR